MKETPWFASCFPTNDYVDLTPYPNSPQNYVRFKLPHIEPWICVSRQTVARLMSDESNQLYEKKEFRESRCFINLKLPVPSGDLGLGHNSFLVHRSSLQLLLQLQTKCIKLVATNRKLKHLWSYDAWLADIFLRSNPGLQSVPGEPVGGWYFRGNHTLALYGCLSCSTDTQKQMRFLRSVPKRLVQKLAKSLKIVSNNLDFRVTIDKFFLWSQLLAFLPSSFWKHISLGLWKWNIIRNFL